MLKKMSFVLAGAVVLAAVFYVQPASTQGAIVIHDMGCTLLDGDGGFVSADSAHAVVTPSGNGTLTCKVKGVANSSGRAVHYDFSTTGLTCGTPAGGTQDWHETVSASGNATLTCSVR